MCVSVSAQIPASINYTHSLAFPFSLYVLWQTYDFLFMLIYFVVWPGLAVGSMWALCCCSGCLKF